MSNLNIGIFCMPPVNSAEFYYSGSYFLDAEQVHISASQGIFFDTPISGSVNGSFTGSFSGSGHIATASYSENSNKLGGIPSTSYALTSSNSFTGSQYISGSLLISGSIAYPDYIDINTNPAHGINSSVTGRISWDNGTRDLIVGAGNNVDIHLGQQEWAYVYNAEPTSLTKGEIVYVSGSQGNQIAVKRADNLGDPTSLGTLGMVGETIASGAEGLILVNGLMRKLNTTGLTPGALLYVSSSAGKYTQTKPISPLHEVRVGYVVKVDANQGEIYIKIDNGYEIGELHDVIDNTTNLSYGDLFVKSGSVWTNTKQLTGSYSITGSLSANSFTGSLNGTASFASTASYWSMVKAGEITPLQFTFVGGVYVANISFATSYGNTNYSISITSHDARTFTIQNKLVGGFSINTNSSVAPTGNTYWTVIPYNNP